ncbi:unnamed protein product, partial [Rotaria magnacalcarata]
MHVFIHICDLYHQLAAGSDQELTALELFRLPTFYNYSQYIYYGQDFYQIITNEFDSRDFQLYMDQRLNQTAEIGHTVL